MKKYILIICFSIISFSSFSIVPIVIDKNVNKIKIQDKNLTAQEIIEIRDLILKNNINKIKYDNNINKTRFNKIIDGLCNSSGTMFFAFVNLGILIYQLRKNIKKEKKNLENEKKSYWYRKIILEKNIDYIFDYFKKSYEIYSKINSSSISEKEYEEIREEYLNNRTKYNELFVLLSSVFKENRITNIINSKIIEHEDWVFADNITEKEFRNKNREIESEIIELLFNYDFKNYTE